MLSALAALTTRQSLALVRPAVKFNGAHSLSVSLSSSKCLFHVSAANRNVELKLQNEENDNTTIASPSSSSADVNATETSNDTRQQDENSTAERIKILAKRKNEYIQLFNKKLEGGDILSTPQAFLFIKSCGPRMVGETEKSRNELVTYVWERILDNGIELNIGLWNTLLSVYIENRHDFEPLEFLKNLWENSSAEPNKTTFSLLIQAYAMKGDPVGAMKIVDFMVKNNSRMTEHVYSWLVQAFAIKGDMEGVEQILSSMRENDITPRHATFGALINAYAERGEIDQIEMTIHEMIRSDIYPSVGIYVSLFDHLARGGHRYLFSQVWDKIDEIDVMKDDIQPLVQSFITREDYESALALLQCSVKQISKNKVNYIRFIEQKILNMLIFAQKDVSEFIKVSQLVQSTYTLPNKPPARLTFYFLDRNLPEKALETLSHFIKAGENVFTKNFHHIIGHYAKEEDIDSIMKVFDFMKDNGIEIDYICCKNMEPAIGKYGDENYQKFISCLKERKDLVLPYSFFGELMKEGVSLQDASATISNAGTGDLFKTLKETKELIMKDFNPHDAAKIVIELHGRGLKSTGIMVDQILQNVLGQKENNENYANEMFEFVKSLMENNIELNSQCYTRTLKALYDARKSEQFFMFVRHMKEHDIEPDVHHYYQMLKMAASVGNSMAAQFCFDKIMDSDFYTERVDEFYQLLILAYGRDTESSKVIPTYIPGRNTENAQKVCQLFEEMEDKGFKISPTAVSVAIKSYLTNKDIDSANRVMEKYGEGKEGPKHSIKNAYMRAHVAIKDHDAANELFEKLKSEKIVTQLQYNEMMRLCEYSGDVKRVEELFQEMLNHGFKANAFTYLHRIRTYITNNDIEPCVDILEDSIRELNEILRVDIFMVVLRHLIPTGNVEKVKKLIDLIKQNHESKVPVKRLEYALIMTHIKAGNIEEASKLLPEKTTDSENLDESTPDIELNPFRKVAKTASMEGDIHFIENLILFLRVNDLHYTTLDTFYLIGLNKVGDIDKIRKLYEERVKDGVEVTEKFVSILQAIVEDRGLKGFEFSN